MRALIVTAAVLTVLVVPAHAMASPADTGPPSISEPSSAATAAKSLSTRSTRFGRIVTDGAGRALYLFTRDGRRPSRCYGACAEAWPPLIVSGRPRAGARIDRDLIGTTRRRDGRRQATYRGQPLYYFVGDRAPAQVTCQNVIEFGGTWLVVAPSGRAIR